MSGAASLIPELESIIQTGSYARRAEAVRRIANLFVDGASSFNESHVALFDDVLCRLVAEIEAQVRAELATRLAPVANAPSELMRQFAHDDAIDVAGPVISQSPRLKDADLVEIANSKGQAHLIAISGRSGIGEGITDVLVRRGNPQVVRNVADNATARLSENGFSRLVQRAEADNLLAEKVGLRVDIPPHLFRDLVLRATAVVQQRLLAATKPETRAEIQRVLDKVVKDIGHGSVAHDYAEAMRVAIDRQQAGKLGEAELAEHASAKRYEDTVATLAVLSGVPIETADRLVNGERPDPILILCKAAGFAWATARAIIMVRPGGKGTSHQALDIAFGNFEKLSPATAQRVLRFWQVRDPDEAA